MKSPIFLLALLAGMGLAQGQGSQINFNNNGIAVGGDHKVYFGSVGDGAGVVGTNFWADLLYVDPATSALTPWAPSISKFRVSTTASPGTWSGKTVTIPPGNGMPNNALTLQLEVIVWDSVLNPTGDFVNGAGYKACSGLFPFTWHDSSPNPQTPSDNQMVNMPAFGITVGAGSFGCSIPEPSVLAFGVLGAAGLLIFRRRN